MATVGNTYMSLADVYRQSENSKEIATIIELLAETNPILEDARVEECNDGTKTFDHSPQRLACCYVAPFVRRRPA